MFFVPTLCKEGPAYVGEIASCTAPAFPRLPRYCHGVNESRCSNSCFCSCANLMPQAVAWGFCWRLSCYFRFGMNKNWFSARTRLAPNAPGQTTPSNLLIVVKVPASIMSRVTAILGIRKEEIRIPRQGVYYDQVKTKSIFLQT